MGELLINSLTERLLQLVLILVTIGLGILTDYLRKLASNIKNNTLRKSFESALNEAYIVGRDAVIMTNEAFVDAIKERSADGKLTPEEIAESARIAREYFIRHISGDSKRILEEAYGPIEEWLDEFIKSRVGDYKSETLRTIEGIVSPK